jgi:hypothetical protein
MWEKIFKPVPECKSSPSQDFFSEVQIRKSSNLFIPFTSNKGYVKLFLRASAADAAP